MKKNLMKRTLAGTLAVMTVAGAVPADLYMNDLFGTAVINASADEETAAAHTYGEPVWEWDGTDKATAVFECEHGDSVETIEAEVTPDEFEPTDAERSYTATVEFGGKTYTDTHSIKVDAEQCFKASEITNGQIIPANSIVEFDVDTEWYYYEDGELKIEKLEAGTEKCFPYDSIAVPCEENDESFFGIGFFSMTGKYSFDKDGKIYKSDNSGVDNSIATSVVDITEDCVIRWKVSCEEVNDAMAVHVNDKILMLDFGERQGYLYAHAGDKIRFSYIKSAGTDGGDDRFEYEILEGPVEFEKVERKEPTCTEDGNRTYYIDPDGAFYYRSVNKNYVSLTPDSLVLPATGHTYGEPVWKWDGTNATATFECEHGDSQDIVEAVITAETNGGMTVYTATVEFGGKTYTDTKTVYTVVKPEYIAGDGCVKLTWDAVEGAEKYAVCGYVSGKWQLIDEGYTTSYILNGLKSGNEYKVAVIAKINGKWVRDFSEAITVSPKEKVGLPELTVTAQNNRLVLDWTAVEGAEKYGVAVYISGKWKVQAYTDADVTTFTSPKLSAGTYKMVVCAKVNGKWNTKNINSGAVECTIE